MKSAQVTLSFGRFGWLLIAMLSSVTVAPACAADVNLQFEFTSDSSNPGKKEFTNKTPVTGLCAEMPGAFSCGPEGGKGSSKIDVTLDRKDGILHPAYNLVQFKIPELRSFYVKSADGREYPVKLKITGVAARYDISPSTVMSITGKPPPRGHSDLWQGGAIENVLLPCSSTLLDNGMHPSQYRFVWYSGPGNICGKKLAPNLSAFPRLKLDSLSIVYQLDTPGPLEMAAGTYEGVTTYRMRDDFDPGIFMQPSRASFDVKVTLKVNHAFRVSLLSDNRKHELTPSSGWADWNNKGRPVTLLDTSYIIFSLETSSPFTMKLYCEVTLQSDCGLKTAQNATVKVRTLVSLPNGVTNEEGRPVSRQQLSALTPWKYKVSRYVSSHGELKFEILAAEMAKMKIGTMYSGTVTVVWDSDI